MSWFGADPGGRRKNKPCFGVACLQNDGSFDTESVDSAYDAFKWIDKKSEHPDGIGIDCPLWWSSWRSGERQVDVLLRKKYRDRIGQTIQAINSLQGAVLIQGVMLGSLARDQFPDVPITETHPKALLKAIRIPRLDWLGIAEAFGFRGKEPETEDRMDALLSAAIARNGFTHVWKDDLTSIPRGIGEMDPQRTAFGPVSYFWFEKLSV